MDRREFLYRSAAGMALVKTSGAGIQGGKEPENRNSRIVIARDEKVQPEKRRIDLMRLENLVDKAVAGFFGMESAEDAWKMIASPADVVGLKVNCLAGREISTSRELVEVVAGKLIGAGIPANRIIIWDRLNVDLERAGFTLNSKNPGVKCFGNDTAGYDRDLTFSGAAGSLLSRTASEFCTVQINMPVLKDHGIVGMTGALKNYFGAIHNPNKYHMDKGNPYVADVYAMPALRDRTKLVICDALSCQYEGGPPFMPRYAWNYNGILVATDPVALDSFGWNLIEEKRRENNLPSLREAGREPVYIATAADEEHRLGTNDLAKADIVMV